MKIQACQQRLKDQRDHLQSSTVALQNEKAEAEAQAAGENGRSGVFLYFGAGFMIRQLYVYIYIYPPKRKKSVQYLGYCWLTYVVQALRSKNAKPCRNQLKEMNRLHQIPCRVDQLIFRAENGFRICAIHESATHLTGISENFGSILRFRTRCQDFFSKRGLGDFQYFPRKKLTYPWKLILERFRLRVWIFLGELTKFF